MTEAMIADALLMTLLIVGSWYGYQEWEGLRELARSWGLPLTPRVPQLEDASTPGVTAVARREGLLSADIELAALRLLPTWTGDLRLEADVILRDRGLETAILKLGLLDATGAPFSPPKSVKLWCRFEDGTDTLGGELETQPAARGFAYWHAQGVELPRKLLGLKDGRTALQLRAEVWVAGRKEAAARVSTLFELGSRGPEPAPGPGCVGCRVAGATYTCPRCREPHHEACYRLNQACTQLTCAAMEKPG